MLLRAGLARLGCRPSWRCLSSVPRIGELRTVRHVVDAHAEHRKQYRPKDLGASWNTLGKLVRQPNERRVLQGTPGMLHPLAADTEQALPDFDAHALATTVKDRGGEGFHTVCKYGETYGTVSSSLIGVPAGNVAELAWLYAPGPPDTVSFRNYSNLASHLG